MCHYCDPVPDQPRFSLSTFYDRITNSRQNYVLNCRVFCWSSTLIFLAASQHLLSLAHRLWIGCIVCVFRVKNLLASILQEKLLTCTLFGGFCCVLPMPTLRRSYNICILQRKDTFCTSFAPHVEYEVTQNTEHPS